MNIGIHADQATRGRHDQPLQRQMHHLRLPKKICQQNASDQGMSLNVLKQPVNVWAALGGPSLELTWVVCASLVDPGLLGKGDYAVCHSGLMDV